MENVINIGGRLHNPVVGGAVTGANEIKDDTKGKMQNVINQETDAELVRLDEAKQEKLTFDQMPTEGSTNPVTSGGVYAADAALQQAIEAILLLIPSAASALNQLADKSFVNSSISTATATFRGTYNLVTDLELTVSATHQQIATALASVVSTADNNDYCFVQIPVSDQSQLIRVTERYKFNGTAWSYEYDLNNSGFTAEQWAAINSGITTLLVTKLGALPTAAELATMFAGKQNTLTFDTTPVNGSANPVTSGGLYVKFAAIEAMTPSDADANNKLVAENRLAAYVATVIGALDASYNITSADGHVTFKLTQADGAITSVQVLTSDIASDAALTTLAGRVSTAESDIDALQDAYAALTQSDVVIVNGALPSSGQLQNIIYRQPDQDHTPPQFYSDYMWNGTTWVLMATYMNAIDPRPKKGSQNLVTSGGVFDNMGALDVSELNATENPHTLATYADLSAALAAIPSDYQKGGMSIKFVSSVDNKYVQYRLMSNSFNTTPANWQGVDEKPTAGSKNLVKSGDIVRFCESERGSLRDVGTYSSSLPNPGVDNELVNNCVKQIKGAEFISYKAVQVTFANNSGDVIAFRLSFFNDGETDANAHAQYWPDVNNINGEEQTVGGVHVILDLDFIKKYYTTETVSNKCLINKSTIYDSFALKRISDGLIKSLDHNLTYSSDIAYVGILANSDGISIRLYNNNKTQLDDIFLITSTYLDSLKITQQEIFEQIQDATNRNKYKSIVFDVTFAKYLISYAQQLGILLKWYIPLSYVNTRKFRRHCIKNVDVNNLSGTVPVDGVGSAIYFTDWYFDRPTTITSIELMLNKSTGTYDGDKGLIEVYAINKDTEIKPRLVKTFDFPDQRIDSPNMVRFECNINLNVDECLGIASPDSSMLYSTISNGNVYMGTWDVAFTTRNISTYDVAIAYNFEFEYRNELLIPELHHNPLQGIRFAVIGDSISSFDGEQYNYAYPYYPRLNVSNVYRTWWGHFFADSMVLTKNNSASQSTLGNRSDDPIKWIGYADRLETLADGDGRYPDVIFVAGGLNDMFGWTLGDFDYTKGFSDLANINTNTICGGLQYIVLRLMQLYPKSKIFLCTPMKTGNSDWGFPEKNSENNYLKDICGKIRELSETFGLGLVDFYKNTNINYLTMNNLSYGDTIHPNAAGHYKYYQIAKVQLMEYYNNF